ncbi:Gamma-glutamyl phosphate reductase, partial [human gut metagenome]
VLHADDATREILEQEAVAAGASQLLVAASQEDWAIEYSSLDLAVRVVDDVDAATEHIRRYSTGHTEAVLSQDLAVVRRFTAGV